MSGGDSRLATWNRIKAEVTGLPVTVVPGDAAVTGVAMLAGLGTGVYGSVDEAIRRCVRPGAPIQPSTALAGEYQEAFGRYLELRAASVVRRSS